MTVSNGKSLEKVLSGLWLDGNRASLSSSYADMLVMQNKAVNEALAALEEIYKVTGETSDGYHTFNELYDYRMVYNAALFNEWAKQFKYSPHKSWKHSDGEYCFGGGWFVVCAHLPTGQITNHYEAEHWDMFQIPESEVMDVWDGHTPQQALERLRQAFSNSN